MWLQDYLVRIQRDVAERGRQRRVEEIPELLRVLAGRQTQELNASSVARDLDLKVDSVRNYVRLLEGHYLVHLIPAFAAAPLKHGVKRPKVLLNDTGLAASLLGLTTQRALSDSGGQIVGALVEAFVATEVIRQLSWAPLAAGYRVSHYRQTGGPEIDLIVEDSAGRVVAIEVKAQASPPVVAPQGFRSLQDAVGDRFIAGLVLYAGAETVPLGDRVRAAPIDILWSTGAPLTMSSDDAGPGAPSPSLVGDAQVFWSYAHADDQREDGRITRLARAVRDEYQFLTGGEQLELFIDEEIQWGERWRSRIDTALDRTSLFVAVLTPTYLRRPECQRELETFFGLADRAGSGRLLLPLRYGPITAEDPDPVITRLVEQAQAHQWIDLEQLRFEEETSAPWRQMVNQLAQRLVDAARTAPTSDVPPSAATSEPFDEGSDLVELTAKINELEPALDELLSTFTHVAEILSSTMDLPPGLAPDRQSRLLRTAAHRAAEALREPLDDMDKAVERVSTLLDGFDQLLAFVLEVPREYSRDLLIEVRDGFDVPETGFEEINQIQPTLRMLGGMSRELRPAMRRIERGLRLISGMEVRLRDWQAAAARALAE